MGLLVEAGTCTLLRDCPGAGGATWQSWKSLGTYTPTATALAHQRLVQKLEGPVPLPPQDKTPGLYFYSRVCLCDHAEMILRLLPKIVLSLGFFPFPALLLPLRQLLLENTLINHLLLNSSLGISFWEI